eukprot:IDg16911t1
MHACGAGATSKLIASVLTYPHEVVRLRMREKPMFPGAIPKYTGMIQALQLIAKEEGRRGLYAGMSLHLARTVPNSALLFFDSATEGINGDHRERVCAVHMARNGDALLVTITHDHEIGHYLIEEHGLMSGATMELPSRSYVGCCVIMKDTLRRNQKKEL